MVDYQQDALSAAFAALADPTRRAILARLAGDELTVSQIAAPYDISLAAVSKHLGVLARAELILQTKDGRRRRCRLNPRTFKQVAEYLDRMIAAPNGGGDRGGA